MKEEKPVVDNSDIMMMDVNELFGDAFTMLKVDSADAADSLHSSEEEEKK